MLERNKTSNPQLFLEANTHTTDDEYARRKFLGYLVNNCLRRETYCHLVREELRENDNGNLTKFYERTNRTSVVSECWNRLNRCRFCNPDNSVTPPRTSGHVHNNLVDSGVSDFSICALLAEHSACASKANRWGTKMREIMFDELVAVAQRYKLQKPVGV